jgi:hypothetical protein
MPLSDDLASLFLMASQAVAQRLTESAMPLTLPRMQTSVTRNRRDPGGWQSRNHEVQQNILAHQGSGLHKMMPLLPSEVSAMVVQCAQELVVAPESRLPFWAPFEGNGRLLVGGSEDPADYAANAADWTARHLVLPALLSHLAALPSLDSPTAEAANDFAQEVLAVAAADKLYYRIAVPIAGLDIPAKSDPVSLGRSTSLRRLSADEQGNIMREWGIGSSISGPLAFTALALVALQMDISTPRDRQYDHIDVVEGVARWLCAFQLCGYSIAGYFAAFGPYPRWTLPINMNLPLTLPSQPRKWSTLSEAGMLKVISVQRELSRYHTTEPASERDLALHRFHIGLARQNSVDSVLDYVIALESLLLPYSADARHGDLGYRFRVHGAHYIGKTKNRREAVANQLTGLYGLRSRLVHGNKYPTKAEIETGRSAAEDLVRRGLLRAVEEGFPTDVAFKRIVLGVLR